MAPGGTGDHAGEPDLTGPLVRLEQAGRTFTNGDIVVRALADASIDIRRGELLVVLGPSGSGKSTLLNLIGAMDRPTSGHVWFDGTDLAHASDARLTDFRRRHVGFVFQFYNLIPTLTARENVDLAVELAEHPLSSDTALTMVNLKHRSDHFPAALSGGEQQRVAIARAIAGDPDLLLCDEPTGALDIEASRQVLSVLLDLRTRLNKAVVIITHNQAIAGLADRVVHIRDGMLSAVTLVEAPVDVTELSW